MKLLAMAVGVVLAAAGPCLAQEEIVVTAARYQERYEDDKIPHTSIVRRADFVVAHVTVESDTRDLGGRRTELLQTLGEIERKARAGGPVTVALLEESDEDDGDVRVKPYSAAAAEEQIRSGQRADTSRVAIMLRTPVQPSDTLATAGARLDAFVRNVAKPGRVALDTGDPELTIVNPGQYRAAIVAAVAVDAKKVLVELGPGHGARIEGLENRIAWRRAGDLELMLYISHRLTIEPARGP